MIIRVRFLVCFSTWLTLVTFYFFRSNMSVAILAMAQSKYDKSGLGDTTTPDGVISKLMTNEGKFIWSENLKQNILASFFYGYASTHLIGSLISAKIGPRILLIICILGSTLFTFLTPFMTHVSPIALIITRILIGIFSGSLYPIIQEILGVWTPTEERTILSALTHSGNIFGLVGNYAIGGLMCSDKMGVKGWEYYFYFTGCLGAVSLIFWSLFVFDNPDKHPYISNKEKEYMHRSLGESGTKKDKLKSIPAIKIVSSLALWAVTIAHFASLFIFYALVTGHAKYLKDVFKFDTTTVSLYSMIPFIANFIVQLIYPPFVDYLRNKKGYNITKIRKFTSGLAFVFGPLFLIPVGFFNNNFIVVITLMSLSLGFIGLNVSGYLTAAIEISPKYAGISMGIMNTFGSIGGFINPTIAGLFLSVGDPATGWRNTFITTGVISFVFGMFFVIFGSSELQNWENKQTSSYMKISNVEEDNEMLMEMHNKASHTEVL